MLIKCGVFVPQCKGTDSDTLKTKPNTIGWFFSTKYDGQYAQIHIMKDHVKFFTSSGKEYRNLFLEKILLDNFDAGYIFEAEYLGTGEGKLGGRNDAACVTTLRTQFAKGEIGSAEHKIMIFDMITDETFANREFRLNRFWQFLPKNDYVHIVKHQLVKADASPEELAAALCEAGWEGIYIKHPDHKYLPGKRVKNALKYKMKNKGRAKIVGVEEGTGKYEGMIGAFICENINGLRFNVGSGLDDFVRAMQPSEVIDKTIEFTYERIDSTYIFPIFKGFV